MPLISGKKILDEALAKKYMVGAFNISNMELIQAVISAAQKLNSPVIIQVSMGAIKYAGYDYIVNMVKAAALSSTVDFALHLDHSPTFEDCAEAIKHGFTSVMIDGSHLNFDENAALTKKVVDYAHKFKVSVEGELGRLSGIEDNINVKDENSFYTDPDEALKFAKITGVDSLAVAVGTKHGAFKFAGEPKLRLDILEKIHKLLPNLPLVLHGASSVPQYLAQIINCSGGLIENSRGVPEEILKELNKYGVCKINTDSDLRLAFTAGVREYLKNNPKSIDPREYLGYAKQKVQQVVADKIKVLKM